MKLFKFISLAALLIALVSCEGKHSTIEEEGNGSDNSSSVGSTENWYKLHLIADFTSQYCLNCPTMITSLETIQESNPGKTVIASFHPNTTDYADAYGITIAGSYMSKFGITGLPSAVINLHADEVATSAISSLQSAIDDQEQNYPAVCGVAIESSYDADTRSLTVNTKVKSNEETKVRYLVLLLEDNIYGYQLGADNLAIYHDRVVRAALTNSVYGEKLNSGSELEIGVEYTGTRTTTLDSSWDESNMSIVVAALISEDSDRTYFVTNCNECTLGGSVDYLIGTSNSSSSEQEETVEETSAFQRNVCVMEFTGQYCSYCPEGYAYMNRIVNKYYEDCAYMIALHSSLMGTDQFAIDAGEEVISDSGITSQPYAFIDMRETAPLTGDTSGAFKTAIDNSFNEYPAHCGLSMSSTYADGAVELTINLYSEKTDKYYIAAWVVEDGLVGYQSDGSTSSNEYKHHHVARALVSSTYKGDSLGSVAKDEVASKTYSFTVDPDWVLENTVVLALAIDSAGYVNNCLECEIENGSTDYQTL